MKRLWLWVAAGFVVGAVGLRTVEALTVDAALERQRNELVQLNARLREKQTAVESGQTQLKWETEQIRQTVNRAANLADQALASQGTAVDRLKTVIAAVRQLKDDLKTLSDP